MDDVIVTAFQFLLREHMKGLQPPSLGVSLTMNPLGSHEFVQVINIGGRLSQQWNAIYQQLKFLIVYIGN